MRTAIRILFFISSSFLALALGFLIGFGLGTPPASTDSDLVVEVETDSASATGVATWRTPRAEADGGELRASNEYWASFRSQE